MWKTGVPVWALLLAVALPITYVLPSGFIYAMTGQGVRLFLFFSSLPPLSLSHCRACTISALLIACTVPRIFIARPGGRGDGRWLAGWLFLHPLAASCVRITLFAC